MEGRDLVTDRCLGKAGTTSGGADGGRIQGRVLTAGADRTQGPFGGGGTMGRGSGGTERVMGSG